MACGCKNQFPSNIGYRGHSFGADARHAFLKLLLQNPGIPFDVVASEVEKLTGQRPGDIMQAIQLLAGGGGEPRT